MRVRNESESSFDAGGNKAPWQFYGDVTPDTTKRYTEAPLMSLYWDVTNSILYVKTANTAAAADWKPLVAAGVTTTGDVTVTGDLTVTGTVQAGDLVATTA